LISFTNAREILVFSSFFTSPLIDAQKSDSDEPRPKPQFSDLTSGLDYVSVSYAPYARLRLRMQSQFQAKAML